MGTAVVNLLRTAIKAIVFVIVAIVAFYMFLFGGFGLLFYNVAQQHGQIAIEQTINLA